MCPKTIRQKLIFCIVASILFIGLSLSAFFTYRSNHFLKKELTNFGFHLVKNLSYGSELGVSAEDPVLLQSSFEGTFEKEEVVLVTVYNKKGKIIASKEKMKAEERISKEAMEKLIEENTSFKKSTLTQEEKTIYNFYSPITKKEEMIGFARVGVSLDKIGARRREIILLGFSVTAVVIIFGILVALFLSRKMLSPIHLLTKGAGAIAKGDLDYQIRLKTGDEFEELGKSFNQMAKSLMNTLEDVEEAKAKTEKERDTTLAIINNLVDGLLLFDKENKLSLINPEAERLFDLKKEEITGKLIKELSNSSLKPLVELLEESKEVSRKELKIREDLILEVSTTPMVKEEESGTLVILHNITKEKRVERLKTEFVSLAAHQLRTPLSAIKWTLRILSDEELGKVNKEQKKYLNRTYQSNERMIGLIDDLLNVTKIEEGRYVYQPKLVHLEDLIQAVIDSLKPEIKRKNIELDFQKPKQKLPEVKVDMEKIKLAIKNLVDNAIGYSSKGGKVTISLKQKENNIKFSVQDSGIGIPEKQQKRIFTKFFRGANAIKKKTEGSGLGLFIVKNIIEAHQGKIWFESEQDKNSTFYFTIPY